MIQEKNEEAINTGKEVEALLEKMEQTGDMQETRVDMHLGYLYSFLCEAYQLIGEEQAADQLLPKSSSPQIRPKAAGKNESGPTHLLINDYKQVIHNTLERERLTPAQRFHQ